jgi:hypothetical protein
VVCPARFPAISSGLPMSRSPAHPLLHGEQITRDALRVVGSGGGRADRKAIRRKRNQYWDAFKHFFDLKGLPREDEELLAQFNDINNDVAMFIGWWDYMTVQKRLPVAAQVFQVWWYALNEEKLSPDADLGRVRTASRISGSNRAPSRSGGCDGRLRNIARTANSSPTLRPKSSDAVGPRVMAFQRRRPSGFIEPCLPSKVFRPPSGPLWVHEIKHDGYRLMVCRDGERVRCFTRNGHDWADASRL